jgi:hypothetical protein
VGFILLIAAFHLIQPYRLLFFSHEQLPLSIGNLVLSLVARPAMAFALSPLEEIAISILCGSAALRLAMLLLGFAGLYQWLLLAAIGTLFVGLGTPRLAELVRQIAYAATRALKPLTPIGLHSSSLASPCSWHVQPS